MNYKIYRNKKRFNAKVIYSKQQPYIFNPAYRKSDDIIDINKFVLYNPKMIDNILEKKYMRRYKNLLKMVYLLFNDAFPGDTGFPAVLDESSKLRATLIDKYNKYLSLANQEKFLKQLDYIDSEVKKKYIEQKIFKEQFMSMDFKGVNR